jgi:sensor histidine kinase YesM
MTGSVDNWTLIIKDNGTGISDDKIAKINSKIEKAMSNMTVGEIGGLGIVNTIVRLKMTHNEKITYKIYNETGMVIEITSRKAI